MCTHTNVRVRVSIDTYRCLCGMSTCVWACRACMSRDSLMALRSRRRWLSSMLEYLMYVWNVNLGRRREKVSLTYVWRACVRVMTCVCVCARADRWTMDIKQKQTHRLIDESMGGWKQRLTERWIANVCNTPAPDEVQAQKHSCAQKRLSAIEQGHPHHLRLDVQGHHWRHVQRNDSELHLLIVVQSWSIHGACGLLSPFSQAAL